MSESDFSRRSNNQNSKNLETIFVRLQLSHRSPTIAPFLANKESEKEIAYKMLGLRLTRQAIKNTN